ncbi:MAG: Asp-tRNA(Asn)/Glu-tRNA(Gln) amidotransferase subunit GatB [Lysobacterales bacterium]
MSTSWQAVIGLEVHVQLATRSKMFSAAATAYGAEPNTQVSWVDAALPGTLPVPNRAAIEMAIAFGLAVDAEIDTECVFARKNYFYPDLPKGYQISQYELPIVRGGRVPVRLADGGIFQVALTRAHLEEDAGKSLHDAFHAATGVDLNRAGTPLLEVVTEPVLTSSEQAVAYLKALHQLVRWLGICDGNMQEGSFRCDANVSVRRSTSDPLGTRTEIKNVNSFRFVEKAIDYEIERQIRVLEDGGRIVQETRLYDAAAHRTRTMRSKEDALDYRYFPDPDLPPLRLTGADVDLLRAALPELPAACRERMQRTLGLGDYDADMLSAERATADYFEATLAALPGERPTMAKLVANWVLGELSAALNEAQIEISASRIAPAQLAALLLRVADGTLSGKLAREVFDALWAGAMDVERLIAERGLAQISDDTSLLAVIDRIIAQFPDQVGKFRAGDQKIFQFLIGQLMRATQGKANPTALNRLLRQSLE